MKKENDLTSNTKSQFAMQESKITLLIKKEFCHLSLNIFWLKTIIKYKI